jgi:hypothetical protein
MGSPFFIITEIRIANILIESPPVVLYSAVYLPENLGRSGS